MTAKKILHAQVQIEHAPLGGWVVWSGTLDPSLARELLFAASNRGDLFDGLSRILDEDGGRTSDNALAEVKQDLGKGEGKA